MRWLLPLVLIACVGCIDKTGKSATYLMKSRIDANTQRMRDIEKDLGLDRARLEAMEERAAAARKRLADSGATLETFLQEMNALRGELADLQYRLEERGRLDEDLDLRLTGLESQIAWMVTSLQVEPPPAGWGVAPPRPAPAEGEEPVDAVEPAPTESALETAPAPEPAAAQTSAEERMFRDALAAFQDQQFDRAGGRLQKFLRQHPDSEWSLEAKYLVAECLLELGRYKNAITSYQKVIEAEEAKVGRKGTHEWAPKAMFKQGLCFQKLGTPQDRDAAKLFWEELVRLYPASSSADRARESLKEL
jgi:TolA-binding protein